MNFLRIAELDYNAKQGVFLPLDNYEKEELIEAAKKISDIQFSVENYFGDIISESKEIKSEAEDIRKHIESALEQIEANDDLPECFVMLFKESLTKISNSVNDILSSNSEIKRYAEQGETDIFSDSF